MSKTNILFLSACIFFASHAKAQDVDTILRHRLFISVASNHLDVHDEQASPLLYYGNGKPTGFGYEYKGDEYRHSFRFSFLFSDLNANELQPDLQNDPLRRRTFFTNAYLTYSYLRNWTKTMDGELQWSYGAALDNVASIRDYKYYGNDLFSSEGIATWDELSMLSPEVRVDYVFNSSERIHSELMLPLISAVGRPAYNFRPSNSKVLSGKDFHVVFLGG